MKRYRGKNANYQRFGSAFVPARKWGKRNKRQFEHDSAWIRALLQKAGIIRKEIAS